LKNKTLKCIKQNTYSRHRYIPNKKVKNKNKNRRSNQEEFFLLYFFNAKSVVKFHTASFVGVCF